MAHSETAKPSTTLGYSVNNRRMSCSSRTCSSYTADKLQTETAVHHVHIRVHIVPLPAKDLAFTARLCIPTTAYLSGGCSTSNHYLVALLPALYYLLLIINVCIIPRAGSGDQRTDPIRLTAGCRKKQLKPGSVCSLSCFTFCVFY